MRTHHPRDSAAAPGGRVHSWSLSALLSALVLLGGCEMFSSRTGGGTETESAGVLRNADGTPAVSARVLVRAADYLADSLLTTEEAKTGLQTWTDARGQFRFVGLSPGSYRLEAEGGDGRGLVKDFILDGEGHRLTLEPDTLRPHGSIYGSFAPDSNPNQGRYVQIYGLERLVKADPATGAFMVNGLPPGAYDLRFLGLEQFRKQTVLRGVVVVSGEVTHLEPVRLEELAKLTYSIDSGALAIDGMGPGSPVILDNEFWDNGVENEYVWAKAGLGLLDLRGNVVTDAMRAGFNTVDNQMAKCRGELGLARLAGIGKVPDPAAGSRRILQPSASGRLEDIAPEKSAGSELIVAEARKATPGKPLLVVAGGPLTTVANAYLTDPSIASRMVVAGIYPFTINAYDSLAVYLVAKRCRFVVWGRTYVWDGVLDSANLSRLRGNRMSERVRNTLKPFGTGGRLSLGDLAPVAYLFSRKAWKAAEMARFSPPLAVQPASGLAFDFLDIPLSGNDWASYQEEFFATLGDSGAYAPVDLPGRLEAEGYSARSAAKPSFVDAAIPADTSTAQDAMTGASGAWIDFRGTVSAAGTAGVTVRYRAPGGGRLSLGHPGQTPLAVVALTAGAGWAEASADLVLGPGINSLRATWTEGSFDLDRIDIR